MLEPQEPPTMDIYRKGKHASVREIIQEEETYGALEVSTITTKISNPYSSYVSLMCDLVDQEPTSYEEATQNKEYQSIINNYVWDIVPKPENKSVAYLKWIYKIKHDADGSIEKNKEILVARGFSQK